MPQTLPYSLLWFTFGVDKLSAVYLSMLLQCTLPALATPLQDRSILNWTLLLISEICCITGNLRLP